MGIETDEFLKAMEGDRVILRQFAESGFGEVTVLVLGLGQEGDQAHERSVSERGRPIVPQLILRGTTAAPRLERARMSAAPVSSWRGLASSFAARPRTRTWSRVAPARRSRTAGRRSPGDRRPPGGPSGS